MSPLEIFKQLFFIGSLKHWQIQFFFFLLKMGGRTTCQFSITVYIPINELGSKANIKNTSFLAGFCREIIGQE